MAEEPGQRQPGGETSPPRLSRPPGERYLPTPIAPAAPDVAEGPQSRTVGLAVAIVAAVIGAFTVFVLGLIDVDIGQLVVAAAVGLGVGTAVRAAGLARGRIVAAAIAGVAVGAGFLLTTLWARTEGGTLDPVTYLTARYGPLPFVAIALGVTVAAIRGR